MRHTCAILALGGVWCWGDNSSGQLGDGSLETRLAPVEVSGLPGGAAQVTASYSHSCTVMVDGTARCWGYNYFGQLGDGTTDDRLEPVEVTGLSGVTSLAAGWDHTCALTGGGKAQCWGDNTYGQLGDGGEANQLTPADVAGLEGGVVALASGGQHTCAILDSGRMKCWGNDQSGQLGLGTVTSRLTPVEVIDAPLVRLWINAIAAQPGSLFTLTGQGFPPGALATVTANGTLVSDALPVLPSGGFVFFLDSVGAEAGVYQITVSANPEAAVTIVLDPAYTLHALEGNGLILNLPAGIAQQATLSFLPLIGR